MVAISALSRESDSQVRVRLNRAAVERYRELIEAGERLDPIVVFLDDTGRHHVGDGHHRIESAGSTGATEIEAEVRRGTRADAIRHGLIANGRHGVQLTAADRRRGVEMLLTERPDLADRSIARDCGVSPSTVGAARARLAPQVSNLDTSRRIGRDGKRYTAPPSRPRTPDTSTSPPAVELPPIVPSPRSPPPSISPPGGAPPRRVRLRRPEPAEIADSMPRPMQLHLAAVLGELLSAPSRPTTHQRRIAALLRIPPRRLAEAIEELERWAARLSDTSTGGAP